MSYAIGVDLGGSSVKVAAVAADGSALVKRTMDFIADERMDWARKIQSLIEALEGELGARAEWIGLSAPGLAAEDGRSIAYMPGRLHGLEGLDWTEYLRAAQPVPVLNDGHSALWGEYWLGAARGCRHAAMLTLGTGVGGAAIVDGRLLRGGIGRAGHFGHISLDPDGSPDICGTPGSLELVIGNCTVRERSKGRFDTTHALVSAYGAGDGEAGEIWLTSVRGLAAAVCSIVNVIDPEAVIIGGGIARAGAALFEPLDRALREIEWQPGGRRVRLLPAELGSFAGAFGAARNAMGPPSE